MANEKRDIFEDENYLSNLDPLTLKRTEQEIKRGRRRRSVKRASRRRFFAWLLVFIIIIGGAAYPTYKYVYQPTYAKMLYTNLKSFFGSEATGEIPEDIQPKFGKLYEKNFDIEAWLTIENVSVPVVNSEEKEVGYYKNHLFDLKKNPVGTPYFADSYKADADNHNTVMYLPSFFGADLEGYATDIEFYKKNPLISVEFLREDKIYKIFAIVQDDEGYTREYAENDFETEQDFYEHLKMVNENSILSTSVTVNQYDKILTIIAETGKEKSVLIFARLMADGEEPFVDVDEAKLVSKGEGENVTYTDVSPTDVTPTDAEETESETVESEEYVDVDDEQEDEEE